MTAAPHRGFVADIPGPHSGPVTGSVREFQRDLLGTLARGMHRYGDVVTYRFGPRGTPLGVTIVVAHHPDDVQRVLTGTERTYSKNTVTFRVMGEMLGHGLLNAAGDEWRRQRRVVQPLFTPRRVEGYTTLMAEEAAQVAATMPADGDGAPVDLHLMMMRYTLRVVGRALFGDDIEDLVPVLDELVPQMSSVTRQRMLRMLQIPLRYPGPGNRRARALHQRQYAVIDKVLARSSGPATAPYDDGRDDLVSRLRIATNPDTGEPLSAGEIRDQALIFLLAGHETTAGALTFTLHLLGRHPEIQDRVATEVREVLGDDPYPTPDQLRRLTFTRAALQEGLRLFPSAHATERATTTEVELGGYTLPDRQIVLVSPWTTHRHPAFWEEPERFDPGRFVGEHHRPRYAYFPFGGGPRGCVGEHFAMLEAVALLASLLRHHQVTSVRAEIPVTPNITLRPAGEVPVTFHPRP